MFGLAPKHAYSFAQYLELEEASNTKHEFYEGEIYAMAGGTPEHAELSLAIGALLRAKAMGQCRVFSSDLRVRVLATGLATYPDVTVVCGAIQRDPESHSTIVNPTLIVEVTSDSTEAYDRSDKLAHYQQVPSLKACLLVSHRERKIEVWQRRGQKWQHDVAADGAAVVLADPPIAFAVDDVFGDILSR